MPVTPVTTIPMKPTTDTFAPRLLAWFENHGRHDLPWQQHRTDTPDAYPVWISEVMLQQTQVQTVIPYFQRFMQSFPTVYKLADAPWDTVAEHWAGLGYYARARNLHQGAKQLVAVIEDTQKFPQTVSDWEQISGVGRSTAGAIVAMGLHRHGVICDGNVKRVLTRWAGISGDISKSATSKQLWALAEQLTPEVASGEFAQAMMDMGATVCHRTKPACLTQEQACPLQSDCTAYAQGKQLSYPFKAKKPAKPSKYSQALMIYNQQGEVLWLQRPDAGIWGGLWCLPLQFIHKMHHKKIVATATDDAVYQQEFNMAEQIINQMITDDSQDITKVNTTPKQCDKQLDDQPSESIKPIKHTLTHFHWYLTLQHLALTTMQTESLTRQLDQAGINHQWLTNSQATQQLALPKAMMKIIGNSIKK